MRGSITKRPGKATKDGKPIEQYYLVYDLGLQWDADKGHFKRRQKWEKVPPPNTRKHAEQLLAERLAQVHGGGYVEPSQMLLWEFAKLWLEKYARGQVRPATMDLYRWLLDGHVLPALGDTPLCRLGVEDIQGLKSSKLAEGMSPQSVKHMLVVLRQMLRHAVTWEYIRTNPAREVKLPTIPRREMDCLTPAEVRLFLAKVPPKWYAFFLTAITTGLRIGELLGMKWGNLDWNGGRYHVREIWARPRREVKAAFAAPKTAGSAQPVDLTPACMEALREHQQRQAAEKLKVGREYQDLGLIFATEKGTPLDHRNVDRRYFEPALEAAGLRLIRLHDLRHTCASLLIAQGESIKYVQRQLRHASSQMTLDRYGHLFPDTHRAAANRLDEMLFGQVLQPLRVSQE